MFIMPFNCRYCSYANGLIAYVAEIAGRTEQHWCPIKHSQGIPIHHSRYDQFFFLEMQLPIVNKRRRYVVVSVISTDEERAIWIWNWPASEKIMSGS
jgi:hypothetical protein